MGELRLFQGDCLDVMKGLPDQSVDCVVCDLPYKITACSWDVLIPFEPLWIQYRRLVKPGGAVVLFSGQPFTTGLISSQLQAFKYHWIWDKNVAASFVQAKRMPLRVHEEVCVFGFDPRTPNYYPIKTPREKPMPMGGRKNVGGAAVPLAVNRPEFHKKVYTDKFPTTILRFPIREDRERGLHPTQKPVALCKYLIETYTVAGQTVLDNCMGSGSTGVACLQSERSFIGIEKDPEIFKTAEDRLSKVLLGRS